MSTNKEEVKPVVRRLYIGGLYPDVKAGDLQERFSKFGDIDNVQIKSKKGLEGDPAKVFAYLNIKGQEPEIKKCIKIFDKSKWKGSKLKIQIAKENFLAKLQKEITQQENEKEENEQKEKEPPPPPVKPFEKIVKGPPGTMVPGEENWVVAKYGRILPVMNLKKAGSCNPKQVDPSKYVHWLKKLEKDGEEDYDEEESVKPDELTWQMDDNDKEITRKRKGEFEEWKPKPKERKSGINYSVEDFLKKSNKKYIFDLGDLGDMGEVEFEIVDSDKEGKAVNKELETSNPDLAKFESDSDHESDKEVVSNRRIKAIVGPVRKSVVLLREFTGTRMMKKDVPTKLAVNTSDVHSENKSSGTVNNTLTDTNRAKNVSVTKSNREAMKSDNKNITGNEKGKVNIRQMPSERKFVNLGNLDTLSEFVGGVSRGMVRPKVNVGGQDESSDSDVDMGQADDEDDVDMELSDNGSDYNFNFGVLNKPKNTSVSKSERTSANKTVSDSPFKSKLAVTSTPKMISKSSNKQDSKENKSNIVNGAIDNKQGKKNTIAVDEGSDSESSDDELDVGDEDRLSVSHKSVDAESSSGESDDSSESSDNESDNRKVSDVQNKVPQNKTPDSDSSEDSDDDDDDGGDSATKSATNKSASSDSEEGYESDSDDSIDNSKGTSVAESKSVGTKSAKTDSSDESDSDDDDDDDDDGTSADDSAVKSKSVSNNPASSNSSEESDSDSDDNKGTSVVKSKNVGSPDSAAKSKSVSSSDSSEESDSDDGGISAAKSKSVNNKPASSDTSDEETDSDKDKDEIDEQANKHNTSKGHVSLPQSDSSSSDDDDDDDDDYKQINVEEMEVKTSAANVGDDDDDKNGEGVDEKEKEADSTAVKQLTNTSIQDNSSSDSSSEEDIPQTKPIKSQKTNSKTAEVTQSIDVDLGKVEKTEDTKLVKRDKKKDKTAKTPKSDKSPGFMTKSEGGEHHRVEAIKQKHQEKAKQTAAVRKALSDINSEFSVNKKVVFGDDTESEDDENDGSLLKMKSKTEGESPAEDSDNDDAMEEEDDELETKESEERKLALFDSSSDDDGDDADDAVDDNDDSDDNRFAIRPLYQGSQGSKLLELQASYGNDKRFQLDKRFIDSDEEEAFNKEMEGEDDEKKNALKILESVVGLKVHEEHLQRKNKFAGTFKDVASLHYDPTREEHKDFELEKEEKVTKKDKKRREIEEAHERSKVRAAEVTEGILQERFIEVSDSIKDAFTNKDTTEETPTFSLLQAFGAKIPDEEEDADAQESHDTSKLTLDERFTGNEGDAVAMETETLDTSVVKTQARNLVDHIPRQDRVLPLLEKKKRKPKKLHTPFFFYLEEDRRLQASSQFCRTEDLEAIRDKWKQEKQNHIQHYKQKAKNFKRKMQKHPGQKDKLRGVKHNSFKKTGQGERYFNNNNNRNNTRNDYRNNKTKRF